MYHLVAMDNFVVIKLSMYRLVDMRSPPVGFEEKQAPGGRKGESYGRCIYIRLWVVGRLAHCYVGVVVFVNFIYMETYPSFPTLP